MGCVCENPVRKSRSGGKSEANHARVKRLKEMLHSEERARCQRWPPLSQCPSPNLRAFPHRRTVLTELDSQVCYRPNDQRALAEDVTVSGVAVT